MMADTKRTNIFWRKDNPEDYQIKTVSIPGVFPNPGTRIDNNSVQVASKSWLQQNKKEKSRPGTDQAKSKTKGKVKHEIEKVRIESAKTKSVYNSTTDRKHERRASLKDLRPEDKRRVANLVKELAKAGEEREVAVGQLHKERLDFNDKTDKLRTEQIQLIMERDELRDKIQEYHFLINAKQLPTVSNSNSEHLQCRITQPQSSESFQQQGALQGATPFSSHPGNYRPPLRFVESKEHMPTYYVPVEIDHTMLQKSNTQSSTSINKLNHNTLSRPRTDLFYSSGGEQLFNPGHLSQVPSQITTLPATNFPVGQIEVEENVDRAAAGNQSELHIQLVSQQTKLQEQQIKLQEQLESLQKLQGNYLQYVSFNDSTSKIKPASHENSPEIVEGQKSTLSHKFNDTISVLQTSASRNIQPLENKSLLQSSSYNEAAVQTDNTSTAAVTHKNVSVQINQEDTIDIKQDRKIDTFLRSEDDYMLIPSNFDAKVNRDIIYDVSMKENHNENKHLLHDIDYEKSTSHQMNVNTSHMSSQSSTDIIQPAPTTHLPLLEISKQATGCSRVISDQEEESEICKGQKGILSARNIKHADIRKKIMKGDISRNSVMDSENTPPVLFESDILYASCQGKRRPYSSFYSSGFLPNNCELSSVMTNTSNKGRKSTSHCSTNKTKSFDRKPKHSTLLDILDDMEQDHSPQIETSNSFNKYLKSTKRSNSSNLSLQKLLLDTSTSVDLLESKHNADSEIEESIVLEDIFFI